MCPALVYFPSLVVGPAPTSSSTALWNADASATKGTIHGQLGPPTRKRHGILSVALRNTPPHLWREPRAVPSVGIFQLLKDDALSY